MVIEVYQNKEKIFSKKFDIKSRKDKIIAEHFFLNLIDPDKKLNDFIIEDILEKGEYIKDNKLYLLKL